MLDEGHEIRNADTYTWQAIRWLRAKYRIVVTATPLIDGVKDFAGIMGMIQPRDDLWSEESLQSLGAFNLVPKRDPDTVADEDYQEFDKKAYLSHFDPWNFNDNYPVKVLRRTSEYFTEHIAKLHDTGHERGQRARLLLKSCVLRRTYNSKIDNIPINRNLPMVQKTNIECAYMEHERVEYGRILNEALGKLHQKKGDKVIFDANQYRRLMLCGTWLNFEYLLNYRVKKLKEFRKASGTAYDILKNTVGGQLQKKTVDASRRITLPAPEDKESIPREFCNGTPKLRVLSQLIADMVVKDQEKVVVWCTLPTQPLLLEKYLQLAAVEACAFHANLNLDERRKLSASFTETDQVSVMIGGMSI